MYKTAELAASAYDLAAVQFFGTHVSLNYSIKDTQKAQVKKIININVFIFIYIFIIGVKIRINKRKTVFS
jgi:hypothetical protein